MVLSLMIGLEYKCEGEEIFPIYYASPFVFKHKSLASSMEYYYSISGLLLNVITWSLLLFLIDKFIRRAVSITKTFKIIYRLIVAILIAFTTLNIAMDYMILGGGFYESGNYWYWDIDSEAKQWGVDCNCQIISLVK